MNTIQEIYFKVIFEQIHNAKIFFISATPIKNTVNDFVPLYEFLIKKTIDPSYIIEGK